MKHSTNTTQPTLTPQRLGRCYEQAGIFVTEHFEDHILVHGSTQSFDFPRRKHAWVERPDGSVWEPASNMVWKREVFEGAFHPQVDAKYDISALDRNAVSSGHWGPWQ